MLCRATSAPIAATMPRAKSRAFECDIVETENIGPLAKKLRASPSKDAAIKALKQVSDILDHAPQAIDVMGPQFPELVMALAQRSLIQHSDRDVKLCTAFCLTHVLRIHAPDTPYDDHELKVCTQLRCILLAQKLQLPGKLQQETAFIFYCRKFWTCSCGRCSSCGNLRHQPRHWLAWCCSSSSKYGQAAGVGVLKHANAQQMGCMLFEMQFVAIDLYQKPSTYVPAA